MTAMELEPPQPSVPETAGVRRGGRSYLAAALIWFGILLAITLVAWVVLWSGGIKEASPAGSAPSNAQRS
jgi:hypothetical protein